MTEFTVIDSNVSIFVQSNTYIGFTNESKSNLTLTTHCYISLVPLQTTISCVFACNLFRKLRQCKCSLEFALNVF